MSRSLNLKATTSNPFKKQKSASSTSNRTIFLLSLSVSSLLVLFFSPTNTLNPTGTGVGVKRIRGVVAGKQMDKDIMEAAFAKIREKVEREKIEYSEDWDIYDMRERLNCYEMFKGERPIRPYTDWLFARSLYRDIVGNSQSSIGSSDGDVKNGFQYEVEAKQAPPKGRGIFALEDIKKGSLIWSTAKTARFLDGPSYRKFIFGLEAGFACDVLQNWGYVQDMGDGDLRVSVDLDEGCMCNDGGDDGNMGCDEDAAREYEGGCTHNYFALKDIKAGEEIECSYGQFVVSTGWRKFGL